MTSTISNAAIFQQLQQKFSEKYGVPTFTKTGVVSTIPLTRPATGINVGTGATGLSVSAFNDIIRRLSPQTATVQTQPVLISGGQALIDIPITSKLIPNQEIPLSLVRGEPSLIPASLSSSITPLIPFIILGGIGLIALTVLKN